MEGREVIAQNLFAGEGDVVCCIYARARGVYPACTETVYFDVAGEERGLPKGAPSRRT